MSERSAGRLRSTERDAFWTAPHKRSEAELVRLLRDTLADPQPYDTAEAFERFHHDDLARLTLEAIDRERFRLRVAWAFEVLTDWAAERLAVLDHEAERRRRRGQP